ncbi:MAG: hypothetical protein H6826_14415 [Planctomycetes bacterium]|nr:hypothetical protein [Planctomycetota bacterium]
MPTTSPAARPRAALRDHRTPRAVEKAAIEGLGLVIHDIARRAQADPNGAAPADTLSEIDHLERAITRLGELRRVRLAEALKDRPVVIGSRIDRVA